MNKKFSDLLTDYLHLHDNERDAPEGEFLGSRAFRRNQMSELLQQMDELIECQKEKNM